MLCILSTFLLASFLPSAQAGSPFYLTAERSFSHTEQPQIRLDYTVTDKPMLVRVLRPKNLDKFLEGQVQISRSYEEPTSALNPGHYFAKGLNQAESPLRAVRNLLKADFRKQFQDTSFSKAIVITTKENLVSVPEQVILSAPAGFDLAREYYVDLQQGGEGAQDLGWWFADSGWREDRYKIRTLTLDPLPDGVYLLQAVQGKTEAQCLIQVSSLAVQVKQSSEQLLVRVINRDLQPVADAKVSYRDGRGQWMAFPKPTDGNGETSYASPAGNVDGKLVVKVESAVQTLRAESAQKLESETVSPLLPQGEGRDEGGKGRGLLSSPHPNPLTAGNPARSPSGESKSAPGGFVPRGEGAGIAAAAGSGVSPDASRKEERRSALVATDFLPTVTKDDAVFIVTDRPIFKPGDEFHYKGVVRAFDDGALKVPAFRSRQAAVSVIRADSGGDGLQASASLTDFGSFSGAFTLDEGQTPGLYRLVAQVDDKPYGGEFRVRDYVKPTFYLELTERSPTVTPGQPFFVKFRARRYSGGAPQDTKFEVFLYRKKFEAPQWVAEAGGGLSAGTDYFGQVKSVSGLTQPQRLFSSIEQRQALDSANTWETAPALDASGEATYQFDLPAGEPGKPREEWIYSLMVRAQDRAGSTAILTDDIYATLSEAQPAVSFSKTIAAVGDKGVKVLLQSSYPDGKPAPKAGGVADITLEQPGSAKGSLVKAPFTTDERGRHELVLPDLAGRGRLTAVATLETLDGKPMSATATSQPSWMVVGGAQGEAVADSRELELYTDSTVLSPGDKARVLALLPAGWGKNDAGTLWQTTAGRKIFGSQSSQVQGRSHWFEVEAKPEYGTGFYHTVTVPVGQGKYQERTLGFRIVPREKRLDVAVLPSLPETDPLKPFALRFEVKRADGSPAANTELAVSVVDRAVYAVQSEFRPGIFDFFYPLPRINLSTFYSDELQGYGYADLLKKPNFALSALKSQSKLAKKAMRDTAGWFPHVVTDAQGRAAVSVDMPANVTEWLVTAIAADKEGRVGEATGKFKTVTDVSVELLGPQFLREGEEAAVKVKLVNHLPYDLSLDGNLSLAGDAVLLEGNPQQRFALKGKAEALWPVTVQGTGHKGSATLRVALTPGQAIHVGGAEEFDLPLKPAAMEQVFAGTLARHAGGADDNCVSSGASPAQEPSLVGALCKRDSGADHEAPPSRLQTAPTGGTDSGESSPNTLLTDIPPTATIRQAQVQVSSGLLGAALHAATVLVSYPYGCTEQLVHSTVPNLVLLDLLKRAGLKPEALGPLAPALTKAEKNAALGIKKIVQNQKADGGFGLWPADSEASVPVTVTALYALKFAQELKIEGAARSFDKGTQWLMARLAKPGEGGGLSDGYVLARYAELGMYEQPWQPQIAFVEQTRKNPSAPMADLVNSLRLFAANKDKSWNRFGQQFKDKAVVKDLVSRLQKAAIAFDPAAATGGETEMYRALGFGFGMPSRLSAALGALEDFGGVTPEIESKAKAALLAAMKNGYWTSTFDTAQVIFNGRALLSREAAQAAKDKAAGRKIAAYAKDGGKLGELQAIPGGYTGAFPNPGEPDNLAEIRLEGLTPEDAAYANISADVPYNTVTPLSQGLTVERAFRRITPKGSEPMAVTSTPDPASQNPLPPGERSEGWGRVRASNTSFAQPLKTGDLIVSEIHIKRDAVAPGAIQPSQFIVIEDSIPSFAEGIEADDTYLADAKIQPKEDSYWSAIKQTLRYPGKTARAAKIQPGGEFRLYQVWRVNHAGKASIPPARAFDMYDEGIRGNTGAVQGVVGE